jgi:hypothetical protein
LVLGFDLSHVNTIVVVRERGCLTNLETCDCKIVFGAQHVQIFAHSANIGVAEIGLVEPFGEVC